MGDRLISVMLSARNRVEKLGGADKREGPIPFGTRFPARFVSEIELASDRGIRHLREHDGAQRKRQIIAIALVNNEDLRTGSR
jgi:hypothetical protein